MQATTPEGDRAPAPTRLTAHTLEQATTPEGDRSTNDILHTTIKERRAGRRYIMKMPQPRTFEGLRGRRLNCTTNDNGKAQ